MANDDSTEPDTIATEMARQTQQAKMLREARDELAQRSSKLAAKKDRKGLARLRVTPATAQRLIEGGQFNTEDLAAMLGVSLPTLRSWMAPADNKMRRPMSDTAKILLDWILEVAKERG